VENLAPTGIRSPDRPARSESLYRLSCPGPQDRMLRRTNKGDNRALILGLSMMVKSIHLHKHFVHPAIHDLIKAINLLSVYHEFRHSNSSLQSAVEQRNFSENQLSDSHSHCNVVVELMSLRSICLTDWSTLLYTLFLSS
jgi:hypothetical protein